ncbi:hypothetical protein N7509_002711 [Penicillium cosmopolitanum]|uniref:Ricin B lectin domain-containing protein n=1 Tax=Penicillium cosmopolitanum TaxID=1131564 RepID=A0A9W9W9I5_9EURO|nr:uncharacterized protein N7509_002711 [Penicillium cosmopolitanum]KAJ5408828.1 hypothetical protein N7509_002711 [Penicillium cosmopolitanum]
MKTFVALGALVALCHSAFGLDEGAYTIGSASLQSNKILSVNEEDGKTLSFSPDNNDGSQAWRFTRVEFDNQRDFLINSTFSGGYINCGEQRDSPCVLGDEPQIFTAELVGDNSYELVSQPSGYFLRADGEKLQIAEWDQSPDEQFVLTQVDY